MAMTACIIMTEFNHTDSYSPYQIEHAQYNTSSHGKQLKIEIMCMGECSQI